ncbi:hypothetical protein [Exiguobacterium sp. CinTr1]|uniref:hypothetical protein n=1 Tax=Exiguobacterium sp. CinTr1 TaxID=2995315 RepID=UPI0022E5B09B|nr:hypothetical protein [Exiguobacterium sp. CinTr1]
MSVQFRMKGTERLAAALQRTPMSFDRGAKAGIDQVLDDWRLEAVSVAPYDTGTLQKNIAVINAEGNFPGEVSGSVTANAVKGGFNYAYFIHEESKHAVTGEPEFLRVPYEQQQARWQRMIERAIEREVGGW